VVIVTSARSFLTNRTFVALFGVLFLICAGANSSFASSASAEDSASPEGPYYMEMKPISVPIRRKSGAIKYYMFLTVSLEFDENDKKSHARRVTPRLRDAFLQDMSGRSVMHKDKKKGLDFELVKKRLLKQAKKVLRKDAPLGVNIIRIQKGA